ncbi:polysaccharide biosynthesis protein [Clostridium homopropionicum DSM 5847]|uniref:Polysaccharide biosynthesis protein n=1 Tax=Clostridium homopropionicum DSM 5847 TaxID=1121318 RepID=A0A0L6ZEY7_9CLOT|nr:oligosaccharide flippase family protein [Clostridium homopropionicum]KOA21338.1 polysaccharide biosynthesis protein [Clostridium homopropionicum DSM 5847]SFG98260.1 Membrane protein involved in the export of O-antigen and teichoic acid [Clostridium homopropionicum]
MAETSKQFLKRFLGFSIGPLVSALIGFITVPITTYLVSPTDFGKSAMYTMGYSISSLFIFLGLDQAFVREYNDEKNKKNLFWNSLIVPLVFSIIIGAIYIIFYKPVSILMFDSIEKYIIMILAFSLPFAVIDRFNMLVIRMQEKAKLYSLFNIFNKLFVLIIMIPYLKFIDNSFKGIINANFISLILLCLLEIYFVKENWKTKFCIDKKLLTNLFEFGLPLIPASIITWFFSSMDRIALRQWSTFEQIGIYSAAFKIVMVLGIVQQAFCTFWTPTAYRWHKQEVGNKKYMEVSDILITIMVILFSFIVLFKDIIIKILSESYADAAVVVPFLLFLPIMYTVSETTTLGISFSKKTSYNILISIVAAGTNYIGNFMLVPRMGALGASISTGVSYIVFFWMRTLISRKLWYKFDLNIYIVNIILMLLLSITSIIFNKVYMNLIIILIVIIYNKKHVMNILSFCKATLGGMKNERYNFSRRFRD